MVEYTPKKVFVLDGKTYLELSYAEFGQQRDTYQGRRFIPLHGMLMEVHEDDYKAFYKDKRREKYLKEQSRDNGDFSYDMLTTDDFNGEDILVDAVADTAGQVEKNVLVDKLRKAVLQLPVDEQELITLHFQQGLSQVDLAKILGINQSNVCRKISKIVEKLKFLMKI